MPLYTYKCSEHGLFDEIRAIKDGVVASCPLCNKTARKILSPVRTVSKNTKMGQIREELFQNLGKEGMAARDMWKYDRDQQEDSFRS